MVIRRVSEWEHGELKRGRGRPKMTRLEGVRKDMKQLDLHESEIMDHTGWRKISMDGSSLLVHVADPLMGLMLGLFD